MYKVIRKAVLGVILCFALLLSAGVLLTACKPAEEQKEQQYTVVYDTQGGGNVKNGVYTPGVNFNLPTPSIGSDPEMYGYSFIGWFYDAECTQPVDRKNIDTSKAVDGVLTFYAGWSNIHKIYFVQRRTRLLNLRNMNMEPRSAYRRCLFRKRGLWEALSVNLSAGCRQIPMSRLPKIFVWTP